jgi:hypothetical protein
MVWWIIAAALIVSGGYYLDKWMVRRDEDAHCDDQP